MTDNKIRWGIMGAGVIANKFAEAVTLDPDSVLVAIASKSLERAESFAKNHDIEACRDYETLVKRSDIDVIYVATTHNFHYENARLVLEHHKHVLVEKPFTVNAAQAQRLADLAQANQCFMMEAVWVRYLPSMIRLKQLLKEDVIGEIKLFNLSFGGFAPAHYLPRLIDPNLAGGVTLDMGIYPITFICFLLGEIPQNSKSLCRMSTTGVDELAIYQLAFPSGCLASINTGFNLLTRSEAMIYGSKGYVEFPNFQEGDTFTIHTHSGTRDVHHTETIIENNHENGFVYQIAEVVKQIRAGNSESPIMPIQETIDTMKLMDAMRAEWEFKYPFEVEPPTAPSL